MLAGCATYTGQTNDPNDPNRTQRGALIGAGIGAVAGLLAGKDATDRRQKAMVAHRRRLLAPASVPTRTARSRAAPPDCGHRRGRAAAGDVIKLNLPDGVTFDFNKTDVKPQFYPALNAIARTIGEYNQTIVEINGHTDNVGALAVNQRISEQRAQSVAGYLAAQACSRFAWRPAVSITSTRWPTMRPSRAAR